MKKLLMLLVIAAGSLLAQAQTEITGTLTRADGTKVVGTYTVSWPDYTRADGRKVQAGTIDGYTTDGTIDLTLPSNAGTRPPLVYTVTAPRFLDYWLVPTSASAVDVSTVRTVLGDATTPGVVYNAITVLPPVTSSAGRVLRYTHDTAIGACNTAGGGTSETLCRSAQDAAGNWHWVRVVEAGADGTLAITATASGNSLAAGPGTPIGAPTVTPTLSDLGAGNLPAGTYLYAYAESDGTGVTTLSPAGSITVAASHKVRVTIGMPRRGVSGQYLYRKQPGDAGYHLVHTFGGGYFQNVWDDNTADDSAGAGPNLTDTTALHNVEVSQGVKFFRTHPNQGTNPADVTMLTGDSGYESGAYSIDAYAPILSRTYYGNSFQSIKTGTNDLHFGAYWQDVVDDGNAAALVWQMQPKGQTLITVAGSLSDIGAADSRASALYITATMPSVTTAANYGVYQSMTGAGSSAHDQIAGYMNLAAGYTGSSNSYAWYAQNQSSNSGDAVGVRGTITGTPGTGVGVWGGTSGGATHNVGVWGTTAAIDPGTVSWTTGALSSQGVSGAAISASTGTGTEAAFVLFNNLTPTYYVSHDGTTYAAKIASGTLTASWNAGVNLAAIVTSSTATLWTTNNGSLTFGTNATAALTIGTSQGITWGASALHAPSGQHCTLQVDQSGVMTTTGCA